MNSEILILSIDLFRNKYTNIESAKILVLIQGNIYVSQLKHQNGIKEDCR